MQTAFSIAGFSIAGVASAPCRSRTAAGSSRPTLSGTEQRKAEDGQPALPATETNPVNRFDPTGTQTVVETQEASALRQTVAPSPGHYHTRKSLVLISPWTAEKSPPMPSSIPQAECP